MIFFPEKRKEGSLANEILPLKVDAEEKYSTPSHKLIKMKLLYSYYKRDLLMILSYS